MQASPTTDAASPDVASASFTTSAAATVAHTIPGDSYVCDLEPFYGDHNHCRGFLLQCRLLFCQWLHLSSSNEAKINYIIGLLHGNALAWPQASNSGARLSSLPFEEFIKKFECIFDLLNHTGCASDYSPFGRVIGL